MMNRLALCQDNNQHGHAAMVNKLCKNAMQLLPKALFKKKMQRKLNAEKSD